MQGKQQARVLIIDNDIRVVNQLQPIFETRGFSVASIGHSQSLDDNSEVKWNESIIDFAQKFRPHVAIVDLRLRNDYMDEESGLLIIPQLASAYNILFSARLTYDVVDRAKEQGVFRCVAKGAGGTTKVLGALNEAAAQSSVQSASVNIQWPAKWNGHSIVSSILQGDASTPCDMADDLVFQLYKEKADNAEISDVTGQMLSQPPPSRSRSTVVKVQPTDLEPSILKLAPAYRIQREQQNYEAHVAGQMRGAFHTQMVASTIFWDMGGLIYSLISGQNIATFADHYAKHTEAEAIVKPLIHLFEEVWRSHYEKQLTQLEGSSYDTLYDLYDEIYKFDRVFDQIRKVDITKWTGTDTKLHPVEWVRANRNASRLPTARIAITHGDLHSENIFVDEEHAWLIDFERTGAGHSLRDFAELEIDILTRLASATIDHGSFVKICKLLLKSTSFGLQDEPIPIPHDIPQGLACDIKKCIDVIRHLRMIARKLVSPFSMSEYRWALLLNSLFVAHHFEPSKMPDSRLDIAETKIMQQVRAFIFAQLICEHFETG